MNNQYSDIAKLLLLMADMLYSKKKLDELEEARAKLKFLILNGGSEQVIKNVVPHIITYATAKKTEILNKEISAFEYMPKIENNKYQDVFIKIPLLAREYITIFTKEEQDIFWKKLNTLIAKCANLYKN